MRSIAIFSYLHILIFSEYFFNLIFKHFYKVNILSPKFQSNKKNLLKNRLKKKVTFQFRKGKILVVQRVALVVPTTEQL